ncbi:hypothetical protein Holit_03325 [Hollandina sp. SP2]
MGIHKAVSSGFRQLQGKIIQRFQYLRSRREGGDSFQKDHRFLFFLGSAVKRLHRIFCFVPEAAFRKHGFSLGYQFFLPGKFRVNRLSNESH